MNGVTLDAGALIAIDRGVGRMIALLDRLSSHDGGVSVPAGVLAQTWRDGRRQARLARLLTSNETEIVPLDNQTARSVGVICGLTGTSDVIDVSVVMCARERGHPVVTSDAGDLARIDPSLTLFEV